MNPSPEKSVTAAQDVALTRFPTCLRYDVVSGFLVFLIALPLCLGIAKASGFPAIGGVITAIVGGIVASLISDSQLTIKGPAAGLIAIVLGCVAAFGGTGTFGSDAAADLAAYKITLAVGVVAAICQILLGLLKAGKLGDFFPTAAVHGLLASIGVIIMCKMSLQMLGVCAKQPGEVTELLAHYYKLLTHGVDGTDGFNLPVAIIGLLSLAIMIGFTFVKFKPIKVVPVQLIVLLVAIPLAMAFNLRQPKAAVAPATGKTESATAQAKPSPAADAPKPEVVPRKEGQTYDLAGKEWRTNADKYLIGVPDNFLTAFVYPDFSVFSTDAFGSRWWTAIKWVFMFAVIASLESLLSAKAVDLLDPLHRKTNLNRDLLGCGVANLIASSIGGLPMISEIVRSRANVDNGAKTRFSNMFHGTFLLLFVALLPFVVKMIPVAALAAMLVFTGFRLAHPRQFVQMYKIGREQFAVFTATIVGIICTDLLIGALIGMALELVINVFSGTPLGAIFSSKPEVRPEGDQAIVVTPHGAAVFSNWLGLRGKLEELGLKEKKNVALDLSETRLVDHTVMEKLHEMEREFHNASLKFEVRGLEGHRANSDHPAAARKLKAA